MEHQESKIESCCVVTCDKDLGQEYWDNQYQSQTTGWDLGMVSPPIEEYINQLTNKDLRILIPGCGNTYEAEYLLNAGFTNITVIDISPTLVEKLQAKFAQNPHINVVLGDFFAHEGEYDLVIEQTFFCAINPDLRKNYVAKMKEILAHNGKIVGVLFNKNFTFAGPPFGGTKCSYVALFEPYFHLKTLDCCYNSAEKRKDDELFIHFVKK